MSNMTTCYTTTPTKAEPSKSTGRTLRHALSRVGQQWKLLPRSHGSRSQSSRLPKSDRLTTGKAVTSAHISVVVEQIRLRDQSTSPVNESILSGDPAALTEWTNLTLDDLTKYKDVLATFKTGLDKCIALSTDITDRNNTTQSEIQKAQKTLTSAQSDLSEFNKAYKWHYSTNPTNVKGVLNDAISAAKDRLTGLTKGMVEQERRDSDAINKVMGKVVESKREIETLESNFRLKSRSFVTFEETFLRSEAGKKSAQKGNRSR